MWNEIDNLIMMCSFGKKIRSTKQDTAAEARTAIILAV